MEDERVKSVAKWVLNYTRGENEVPHTRSYEIYSKLLFRIAAADGELAPSEREWIIGQRAALGASDELLEMLETYEPSDDDWGALLEFQRSFIESVKHFLIYDAFQAASADSELHEDERKAISQLGKELGIDESTIEKIAQLHRDEEEIKKRRIALLAPHQNKKRTPSVTEEEF
ncbi:unnamed protein product [Adineta steineri]|uniref:Co-chaperone DjlA N-terminal domain-containing protein n=1 Tax=Adineta steineri TaxID=433720 RepID=A0A819NRK7_9BILA|nr:unnamed protein product [Adineta steineri]CAF1456732.1 unnamed protein product [Adineta steineri]CAF3822670.1 unnamed protein product [Adineta steineri]CAF3998761.1 unnamed protein product [Adineta steineri]